MDDIFNSNIPSDNSQEATPESPSPAQAPQSTPLGTNPAGNFNTATNGSYSHPYNASQPYNSPYNQGYNGGYFQQTNPNTQPPLNNSYPQYQGRPQPTYQPPKKKKSKSGKSVFAILVCICIVIASLAIGVSLKDDSGATKPSTQQGEKDNANISAADPKTENTPYEFTEYSGKGEMTPDQVYEAVKDINVAVIVYSQNQKVGEGSGIVVGEDKDGVYTYIITCAHVISDNGVSIQVQFNDEKEYDADIVGYDSKTDVGVLRIKATGFKSATFGNSDKLTVGQSVYAIGNPGGTVFFGSFTNGLISAIDRPVASSTSAYDLPCIQHNAAINPGNSGGALVNAYGQVIGLNSSKITSTEYEGMGFSVPSNTMLEIYKDIVENGYVTNRPMLGISYYAVSSDYTYSAIAWRNNLPYGSIVIASISDSSDLGANGVKVGDIITGVNGEKLNTTDILLEAIEGSNVGDKLKLSICRLNNSGNISSTFEVEVTLIEDKGETASTQQEQQPTDPFSSYFGNGFGY